VEAPEPPVASSRRLAALTTTFLARYAFVFTTATFTATAIPTPEALETPPASAVAVPRFFEPAWILFAPPAVAIVWAVAPLVGAMYASVVEISTTTARAALLF